MSRCPAVYSGIPFCNVHLGFGSAVVARDDTSRRYCHVSVCCPLRKESLAWYVPIFRRFLMKKLESVRDCVLRESRRFNGVVWRKLHIIITTCATNSAFSELRYSYIYSKTDKSFLPFRTQPVRSCTVVTLGVGNEVTYETNLQQKYPSCRFYGADPYPETGEVFKKVGKIFYTAIDNVTSTADNLWVLRNGSYGWQNGVRVTSLGEFIRDMAQVKLVHYMSMDVEGAEYRIIPYVTKGDFEVESGNAVICQISAEFHGPLKDFNISMTEFESMWTKLISDSPYVPLRAYPPGNHHRFNLFNAKNEDCVRMFLL